jgi:hypothetical protein
MQTAKLFCNNCAQNAMTKATQKDAQKDAQKAQKLLF